MKVVNKIKQATIKATSQAEAFYNTRAGHFATKLTSTALVAYTGYKLTNSRLFATMISGIYVDVIKATQYTPTNVKQD